MSSFQEYMNEYKKQLQKGHIQLAYQGLMQYIRDLKSHFNKTYPEFSGSSSIYYGYMDMTYFPLFPKSLKDRKLKIAIVFVYEKFRFEVWLAGFNKTVQSKYWKLFKESDWNKYQVVPPEKGVDSIVEYTLVEDPDFNDLDTLTNQIEQGTVKFIKDVEGFLSNHSI